MSFAPFAVFLLLILAGPVRAAEVERIPPDQQPAPAPAGLHWSPYDAACDLRFGGTIESGDFDRVRQSAGSAQMLCLDSPGGNLAEALRIAEYLQEHRISTKLTEGAVCLSSCAIIFMAGTSVTDDDVTVPLRVMHPTAQLGFHAPRLVPRESAYTAENVERAYTLALATLSMVIQVLGQQRSETVPPRLKPSLIARLLDTPFDSMELVDTVDEAGRWDIAVWPLAGHLDHVANMQDIYRACSNRIHWDLDLAGLPDVQVLYHDWADVPGIPEASGLRVVVDEVTGLECSYVLSRDSAEGDRIAPADHGFFHGPGGYPEQPIDRFAPATPLADLH